MNGVTVMAVLIPALALTLLTQFANFPTFLSPNLPPYLSTLVVALIASLSTLLLNKRKPSSSLSPSPSPKVSTSPTVAPTNGNKEAGQVKWFNASKGFGFITRTNGEEIFVHFRSIPSGRALREGQRVEFAVTTGAKGLQAEDVVALK
jgi:cold shock protein